MTPQLFGAKNNVASSVEPCTPWTFKITAPPSVLASKAAFADWRLNPSSEHLVFTGSEGTNASIRVSKQNPLRRLHALVADFDTKISDETCRTLLDRCPADTRPTYASQTFSGGARVVWMFAAPLALEQGHLAKEFLKIAAVELKVKGLFGGFDSAAFGDLSKLYDVGQNWSKLGENYLSENLLNYWLTMAARKTQWDNIGEIVMPIEAVAAEVERQFPGRWEGEFEVDKRGVAFWEVGATNPTAAIVTPAGMISFSSEQLFYPWSQILGGAFIRKYQADKIGAAVAGSWFDGKFYYMKSSRGIWESLATEDLARRLKVKHGIGSSANRGEVASEMDHALVYMQEHRRVAGVLPKLYDKEELIYSNGLRYLNNAAVLPVQPADTRQEWGVNFPWLGQFFDTCFDAAPVPCTDQSKPAMPAKVIFLGWWKRFYCGALAGALTKGQAMFLAGGVDRGKTLLSSQIIGRSVGGYADASDFLNHATSFNKQLLEVSLWCIDDGTASQDAHAHLKFSEMIKRSVANPQFAYHVKFRDALMVVWYGRVLITLNDDHSSIRILPNLDASIEDKIIVLLFSELVRVFPDWHEIEEIISRELPFLLRWLVDWEMPPELIGNKRFGVNSYINESLRVKALNAGGVSDLLELVELWIDRGKEMLTAKHGAHWHGTATQWLAELAPMEGLKGMISKYSARQLGRKFVEAARTPNSRITVGDQVGHGNTYRINLAPVGTTEVPA